MSDEGRVSGQQPLPGAIDALGEGFAIAISRPLLIVPLVVLEIALLLAPRLTVGGVASDVASDLRQRGANWEIVADEIDRLEGYNLLDLIASGLPGVRVGAFSPLSAEPSDLPGWHDRRVVAADALVVPAAMLSVVASLVFIAFFRLLLAAGIGAGSVASNLHPRGLARLSSRFAGAALTAAALLALVGLPVIAATVLLTAFDLQGAALLWLFLLVPVIWGVVHFYFVVHALVVDRLRVLPAFRASYQVVRRDPWQAVRFIAVSLLLSTGLTYVLESLARRPEWVVLAVVLNAFLATGMILAAMLFYRDRARLLGLSPQEGV